MALFLDGKQIDKENVYADNIPMSASDSDTIADKFDGLNSAEMPITSGSATNTKSYIDSGLSGKADTGAFIMNLNNNYYSNSTNLQLVVGLRSASFSSGSATIDVSAFLGSGYAFISIAFACAKSTSAIAITGAEVSGTTLTIKSTYTGTTTTDVQFLLLARKI